MANPYGPDDWITAELNDYWTEYPEEPRKAIPTKDPWTSGPGRGEDVWTNENAPAPAGSSPPPKAVSSGEPKFTNLAAVKLNPALIAQGYEVIEEARPFIGYDISQGKKGRVDVKFKGGGGYSGDPASMQAAIDMMNKYNEMYPEAKEKVEKATEFAGKFPSDMIFDREKFRKSYINSNFGGIDPYTMNINQVAMDQFNQNYPRIFNEYFARVGKKYGDRLNPEEAKAAEELRANVMSYYFNSIKAKRDQAVEALEDGMSRFDTTKGEYDAMRKAALEAQKEERGFQRDLEKEYYKSMLKLGDIVNIGDTKYEAHPLRGLTPLGPSEKPMTTKEYLKFIGDQNQIVTDYMTMGDEELKEAGIFWSDAMISAHAFNKANKDHPYFYAIDYQNEEIQKIHIPVIEYEGKKMTPSPELLREQAAEIAGVRPEEVTTEQIIEVLLDLQANLPGLEEIPGTKKGKKKKKKSGARTISEITNPRLYALGGLL